MPKFIHIALLSLFIFQCANNTVPEEADEQVQTEYISILDTIPPHIQGVENLAVFPGDSKPIYSIELIPVQTYGKTGEPYLSNIRNLVVDDQGRVIILDVHHDYSNIIHVFNDDGTYHSRVGGQGKGPGEYELVLAMQAKASKLFVLDYNNLRLNEYSTSDYSLERTILYEQWKRGDDPGYVEARNDGNYLVIFSDSRTKIGRLESEYLVTDSEGNRVNFEPLIFPAGYRIRVGEVMRPTMPVLFKGSTITSLSDQDVLHSVWTPDFLIRKYDSKGIYQSAIYYPVQGLPFHLDDYTPRGMFEPDALDIGTAFERLDETLPEAFPVVDALIVDDENRIWVAVPMDSRYEMVEWWILAPSGELLAKLRRPRDSRFVIKNGYLYGNEIDENTGVGFVAKYRINLVEI